MTDKFAAWKEKAEKNLGISSSEKTQAAAENPSRAKFEAWKEKQSYLYRDRNSPSASAGAVETTAPAAEEPKIYTLDDLLNAAKDGVSVAEKELADSRKTKYALNNSYTQRGRSGVRVKLEDKKANYDKADALIKEKEEALEKAKGRLADVNYYIDYDKKQKDLDAADEKSDELIARMNELYAKYDNVEYGDAAEGLKIKEEADSIRHTLEDLSKRDRLREYEALPSSEEFKNYDTSEDVRLLSEIRDNLDKSYWNQKNPLSSKYAGAVTDEWNGKRILEQYGLTKEQLRGMTDEDIALYIYLSNNRVDMSGKYKGYSDGSYLSSESLLSDLDALFAQRRGKKIADEYLNRRGVAGLASRTAYGLRTGVERSVNDLKHSFSDKSRYENQKPRDLSENEYASQEINAELRQREGFAALERYVYGAAETTGYMVPSITASTLMSLAGIPGGEIVGTGMMSAQASRSAYDEMLREGRDARTAAQYSALIGAMEGGLQYILGGIGSLGGVASEQLLAKVASMEGGLKKLLLTGAIKIGSETTEEELQNFLQPALKTVFFDVPYEAPNFEEILETAIVTALSTGALEAGGIISAGRDIRTSDVRRALIDAGADKETARIFAPVIAENIRNGALNETEDVDTTEEVAFPAPSDQTTDAQDVLTQAAAEMADEQTATPEEITEQTPENAANKPVQTETEEQTVNEAQKQENTAESDKNDSFAKSAEKSGSLAAKDAQITNYMVSNIINYAKQQNVDLFDFYEETKDMNAFSPSKADIPVLVNALEKVNDKIKTLPGNDGNITFDKYIAKIAEYGDAENMHDSAKAAVADFAETLGKAGEKVFNSMYGEEQNPADYLREMMKAYNAGKTGVSLESVTSDILNAAQKEAAYIAGQADAQNGVAEEAGAEYNVNNKEAGNNEIRGEEGRSDTERSGSVRVLSQRAGEQASRVRGGTEGARSEGTRRDNGRILQEAPHKTRKVDAQSLVSSAAPGQTIEITDEAKTVPEKRARAKARKNGVSLVSFKGEMRIADGRMARGYHIEGTNTIGAQYDNALHGQDDITDHEVMERFLSDGKLTVEEVLAAAEDYASRADIDKVVGFYVSYRSDASELVCDGADHINQVADMIREGYLSATKENVELSQLSGRVISAIHKAANELTNNAFELTKDEFKQYSGESVGEKRQTLEKVGVEIDGKSESANPIAFSEAAKLNDIKHPKFSEQKIIDNRRSLKSMEEVAHLTGDEFPKGEKDLKTQVLEYFSFLNNSVYSDVFGTVNLSPSSWRSERRHGMTKDKAVTFAAVPDVIKNGRVIDIYNPENKPGVERIVLAAPIRIGESRAYVGVMLQRDYAFQRLYLHDVVTEKSQGMKPLTQTRPDEKNVQVSRGQSHLDISSILLNALGVKIENKDLPLSSALVASAEDKEYLSAVKRGDMETAQRMVDEAAKKAGYTVKAYHGSSSFGNTIFNGVLFATDSQETAGTYSGTNGPRNISEKTGSSLGMYRFYANTDGMLELDAAGAETNHIALGEYERDFNNSQAFKSWRSFATVNQIIKYAKEKGYKGVVVKNVIDGATPQSRQKLKPATDYIFFMPQDQVRSADAVTYDDEGNVIPLSERFNEEKQDIRFSMRLPVEETDRLIAWHNMGKDALESALELGGLAMPSFAVMPADRAHTDYGDISIVAAKDSIDPKKSMSQKIYGGDAWTPTFPQVDYKISESVAKNIEKEIRGLIEQTGAKYSDLDLHLDSDNIRDMLERRGGDFALSYRAKDGMKLAFLEDTGRKIDIPYREKFYTQYADIDTLKEIIKAVDVEAYNEGKRKEQDVEPTVRKILNEKMREDLSKAIKDKEKLKKALNYYISENETVPFAKLDSILYGARNLARSNETQEVDTYKISEVIDKAMSDKKVQEEYEEWLKKLGDGIVEKKGVRNNVDLFTPSGNRRSFEALHYDYTLANIVRAMQAQAKQGRTQFLSGSGSVKGAALKSYESIEAARADRSRLLAEGTEEMKEAYDDFSNDVKTLAEKVSDDPFTGAEILADILSYAKTESAIERYLRREYLYLETQDHKDLSRLAKEIYELGQEANTLPMEYFEAKLYRAFPFSEAAAVVVPEDIGDALIDKLKAQGANVLTYKPGDNADRLEKVNGVEAARFSQRLVPYNELAQENEEMREKLTETVRALRSAERRAEKAEGELKRTETPTARAYDVQKLARETVKAYDSKADVGSVTEKIQALADYIIRGGDTVEGIFWDEAKEKACAAAREIIENASVLVDNGTDGGEYARIKDYLKKNKISLTNAEAGDITDFAEWKKAHKGIRVGIHNGGKAIDTAYQELAADVASWLFPEDITSAEDQLYRIAQVLDTLAPVYENPYDAYMAEAIELLSNEIMDDVLSDAVRQTAPTFADKAAAKVTEAEIKTAEKYKAEKREAVERLRAQKNARIEELKEAGRQRVQDIIKAERENRDKKIAAIKGHYRDIRQQKAEKRFDRRQRERLLHIARRLRNKKLPAATRALVDEYIGELDLAAIKITGKKIRDLEGLQRWYDKFKAEKGADFLPLQGVENKLLRLSEKRIGDLTANEVAELTDIMLMIEHTIAENDKLLDEIDRRDVQEQAMDAVNDIRNSKGALYMRAKEGSLGYKAAKIPNWYVTNTISAERMARRIVDYNKNSPLVRAVKALNDGQLKMNDYKMRAYRRFDKWTNDKAFMREIYGKKAKEIKITGFNRDNKPQTVSITPAVRMDLYLHSKNEQNLRHIDEGGYVVPNMTLLKKGDLAGAYDKAVTLRLSPSSVRAIVGNMSGKEKAFADAVFDYFQTMSKDEINKVSEKAVGYAIANVDNYYPIESNKDFVAKDLNGIGEIDKSDVKFAWENERIIGALNPIMAREMTYVINKAVDQHARYIGLRIPIRNFNKLRNATIRGGQAEGTTGSFDSIDAAIRNVWGSETNRFFDELLKDLAGRGRPYSLFEKLRGNYARAVLTLNAAVAFKQAASYPTAAAVVGWKPLIRAMRDIGKVDLANIEKYTPLQWLRSQGYSSIELGDLAKNERKLPEVLNWIQGMDVLTTRKLWKAAEYYIRDTRKDLEIGTKTYYEAVSEIYNRIIEQTQPNYTTMQRPQILRSHSDLIRGVVMFATQRFQNFGILYDAFGELDAARRAYRNTGTEQAKAAFEEARKRAGWAMSSQLVQAAIISAITMFTNMIRGKLNDKDKDKAGWSALLTFLKNIGSSFAGMIPFGDTFWQGLDAAALGGKFYGLENVSVSVVNDVISALISIPGAIGKGGAHFRLKMDSLLSLVSKCIGQPYDNVKRLFKLAFRAAAKSAAGEYYGNYLYLRLTEDPTVSGDKAKFYDNLYAAYKEGDYAQYVKIYDAMNANDNFTEKSIKNAMENRMKDDENVKIVKELSKRYAAPNAEKLYNDVMTEITSKNVWGKTTQEAKNKITGAVYDYAVGNDHGQELKNIIEGGADVGLTATDYFTYLMLLYVADKPNKSGNYGTFTNDEKEEAISGTKLTKSEKDYLWAAVVGNQKNKPTW